ncbi:MAG: carbohydrate ABC transporter permease [Treponema sp.]|nr:carbohydrate ABC transporter permease [Treponema sp.]
MKIQIKSMIKTLKKINLKNIVIYIVLVLISYQFLYPLLRMTMTALMSQEDIINPTVNWLPKSGSLGNLRTALRVLELRTTLVNSLLFSGTLAICQTLVSAMTGYAFARYKFKFKNFWFIMVILTFILPTPIMLIPRTMMAVSVRETLGIQMIGTPYPQLLMAITGQGINSAILVLIFFHFFRLIPRALDEAASIDGASSVQIFYHVILKLSLSTILIVFLFSFVWNWNETYITNTFIRGQIQLLPPRLAMFDSIFSQYATASAGASGSMNLEQQRINEAYKMSATLISIIPLFILYLIVQRKLIKGIESAGITGE